MASRNEQGMVAICNHCGYRWLTNSQRSVTSCPNCGWRVRLAPAQRINTPAGQALITSRNRGRLI